MKLYITWQKLYRVLIINDLLIFKALSLYFFILPLFILANYIYKATCYKFQPHFSNTSLNKEYHNILIMLQIIFKKLAFTIFIQPFGECFDTFFLNNCYTATTNEENRDILRFLEKYLDFIGSTPGSSLVAVGSSLVALQRNFRGLLPVKYLYISITYKGESV